MKKNDRNAGLSGNEPLMLTRRHLLMGMGVGAATVAAGLSGCAAGAPQGATSASADDASTTLKEPTETVEADVVVVGSGIAGMSAAMDPVEAGHKVMLVDKLERAGALFYDGGWQATEAGLKVAADATCAARA